VWPGDQSLGQTLLRGGLIINGQYVPGHEVMNCIEKTTSFSQDIVARIHGFEWLRDLKAVSQNMARKTARHMISHWIYHNHSWTQMSWRTTPWCPQIMGHRLSNWIQLYDFFGSSADEEFREIFFTSLYRQAKHLSRSYVDALKPCDRFNAIKGLFTAASVGIIKLNTQSLLKQIEVTLKQIVLDDGTHKSGSPILQCFLLKDLIDIRNIIRQNDNEAAHLFDYKEWDTSAL
jgi:uncharacterized heparinase superfamily protein